MAQKAEVKGSWPGSSAGKGLLTEGPRTPTAELREGWQRLEVAFPCRVGARPKAARLPGAKFGRVPSSKCLAFPENYRGSHTRSLGSCSKNSALEAARPGQAGFCPGGTDRTAW